jgi:pimeloyl-ACP methyl ester carboxylesterase
MLNTIVHGSPSGAPPLLIAHGLYGSARNWGVVSKRLSSERQVIAVDMRNHGESPHDPDMSYEAMADDLSQMIAMIGGQADVLGHSMGGKAAMVLALREPQMIGRLIIADIAPMAYAHSQIEYVRALQSLDLGGLTRRTQANGQLAGLVPDPALRAFFLQSLALEGGRAFWRLNLNVLADQMPLIMGFPETGRTFAGPALFLTGAASDYVTDTNWPEVLRLFPNAERQAIKGAGHWLHAQAPRAFVTAVQNFLDA